LEGERGCLGDGYGRVRFRWTGKPTAARAGDIVEVQGRVADGELLVGRMGLLAPFVDSQGRSADGQGWDRDVSARRENLRVRAAALQAIRGFFTARDFLEVETPILVRAPDQEAHLQVFQTEFRGETTVPGFLITSPEHHMKRLLGEGFERIFQVCRCFRNGERSATHNPEFTMVEWYQAYASYEEIMDDVEGLIAHVARRVRGTGEIQYQGTSLHLETPWKRIDVRQAFRAHAGIDLHACEGVEELRRQARALGHRSVTPEDSWEAAFFKIFLEKVEPVLAQQGTVLLKDYPARLAALAKLKEDDLRVAERVEAYVGGLELANGFTELNDPQEQRQRFLRERQKRLEEGFPLHPLDEDFLAMMGRGMPPAGGMALGVDRLVMLLTDAASIDEVMAFPFEI